MKMNLSRDTLLKPLAAIIGVVERRQTLPILSNVHLSIQEQQLAMTATDLEVELQARVNLDRPSKENLELTIPGRKLMDICRSLPESAPIELSQEKEKILLRSGRSRFTLATLPATDFPLLRETSSSTEFTIPQQDLRYLLERTHFAMAQQDVRYYLNGMLIEVNEGTIKAVATDGHRLALNAISAPIVNSNFVQVILPRKGVTELMRLLDDSDKEITVQISNNHVRITGNDFTFTSKLIDGRFPDYEKVLPRNGDKIIALDREELKQALLRVAILSNEKFRGVRIQLRPNLLKIIANNPEHEEAEEEININYSGADLEIGFNVTYILDILNTLDSPQVKLIFGDAKSSVLIEEQEGEGNSAFVVMPMML